MAGSWAYSSPLRIDETRGRDRNVAAGTAAAIRLNYERIDAASFPRIVSYLTVQNDSGATIGGLTKDNFLVFEDGTRELPIEVAEIVSDSSAVSVVLVIDRSGSMQGQPLTDAKNAANLFVQLMTIKDQAALVSFSSSVTTDQGFTKDKALLSTAINALQSSGGTAIYDAVIHAADLIAPVPGRRAFILLTDGADKNSTATFTEAFNKIAPMKVPIYAIGLGPNVGSVEEGNLRQLADSTNGRYYYSPTSKELEAIYRQISALLHHSYRLTYTTHNCTMDGTLRQVRIEVQYGGLKSSGSKSYRAPENIVTLAVTADSLPVPGGEFGVKLEIPAPSKAVLNLSTLRVVLKYNSLYLRLKTPQSQSVIVGPFFGAPGEYTLAVSDNGAGSVTLDLKRNPGLPPINGRGVIAKIFFVVDQATPESAQLKFELANLEARTSTGCLVAMRTEALTVQGRGLIVWPGDTNHNGRVELADVLVLGVYWNLRGPARTGPEDQLAWMPHVAVPYAIRAATHADADGSGSIIERDLIPIGLNWGKVATTAAAPKVAPPTAQLPEGEMQVTITPIEKAGQYRLHLLFASRHDAELAGVTFRVVYPHAGVNVISAQPGTIWLEQPLVVTHNNDEERTLAMGVMTPAGARMPKTGGQLVEMLVQANRLPALSDFVFKDVALVAVDGRIREISVQAGFGATSEVLPQSFAFYPAYPNPISTASENLQTTWRYYLPENAVVKIGIYNVFGQQIRSIEKPEATSGYHTLNWNGADAQGRRVGSGLYFVAIEAVGRNGKTYRSMQKITVVK
ncbi:VWA domain-containing protein [candidate division KSB1 bacterium]|nr:VWA domain-containing protein [candidate division KSB1 bacterium]